MRQSMTGFASVQGDMAGQNWTWELRGVNGKGLDLRLRLPDGIDGLEPAVRARVAKVLARGNVQINLKLATSLEEGVVHLDEVLMHRVLDAMAVIEQAALDKGLSLAPSTAADLVGQRGMLSAEPEKGDPDALRIAVLADFDRALDAFVAMRTAEGDRLAQLLSAQIDLIETLVGQAAEAAATRASTQPDRLRAQLARVMESANGVDEQRMTQELAIIAVKSDITEELDRLGAHIAAARDLLETSGSIGRKFDFLTQEFNREANTLCSKAGDSTLTQIGLALKTVIDQMREQVANVE